jgi:catechol 2,3-dioxygenase-like lactoylglutathione lyase family enzyme
MTLPQSARVVTFLGTRNRAAAKAFYCDILGLKYVSEDPFALVLETDGKRLRISELKDFVPRRFTALGWDVADIVEAVRALKENGASFQIYQGFGQDEYGIWTSPDRSARVAWFLDPDGNILSLTQLNAAGSI